MLKGRTVSNQINNNEKAAFVCVLTLTIYMTIMQRSRNGENERKIKFTFEKNIRVHTQHRKAHRESVFS